jgi:hypothetical protein
MEEILQKCFFGVRHHLERAIVSPEADARHILEPNRKSTGKDKEKKTRIRQHD